MPELQQRGGIRSTICLPATLARQQTAKVASHLPKTRHHQRSIGQGRIFAPHMRLWPSTSLGFQDGVRGLWLHWISVESANTIHQTCVHNNLLYKSTVHHTQTSVLRLGSGIGCTHNMRISQYAPGLVADDKCRPTGGPLGAHLPWLRIIWVTLHDEHFEDAPQRTVPQTDFAGWLRGCFDGRPGQYRRIAAILWNAGCQRQIQRPGCCLGQGRGGVGGSNSNLSSMFHVRGPRSSGLYSQVSAAAS